MPITDYGPATFGLPIGAGMDSEAGRDEGSPPPPGAPGLRIQTDQGPRSLLKMIGRDEC